MVKGVADRTADGYGRRMDEQEGEISPIAFGSWEDFWRVRHDGALWRPYFQRALHLAGYPTAEVALLTPSQYPTARAGDVVITVYPDPSIAGSTWATEVEAHALTAGHNLPIPALLAHGEFPSPEGAPRWGWLIESVAGGRAWSEVNREPWTAVMPDRAAADLGVVMRRLHGTPHDHATFLGADWSRFLSLVQEESAHLGRADKRLDEFPLTVRSALEDLAAATVAAVSCREPSKLLHGDLHGDNVFVDPASGALTALIDLNEMCAGAVWYDLADVCFRLFEGEPTLVRQFLAAYGVDLTDHSAVAMRLLGWGLVHDFDGLTGTIGRRGLPPSAELPKIAGRVCGLSAEPDSN